MSQTSANQEEKDYFKRLPHEVILKIFSRMDEWDILSLSLVNKNFRAHTQDDYLWHLMFMHRFGVKSLKKQPTPKLDSDSSSSSDINQQEVEIDDASLDSNYTHSLGDPKKWKKFYLEAARLISFIAQERRVVWLDEHFYWVTKESDESEYGQYVQLNQVWWFDVQAKIKSVPAGTYNIIWRFRENRDTTLKDLRFQAEVIGGVEDDDDPSRGILPAIEYVPDEQEYFSLALEDGWVEYHLPVTITVPDNPTIDKFLDVEARIINHNTAFHKRGLAIDYVRLQRAGNKTNEENPKSQNQIKQVEEDTGSSGGHSILEMVTGVVSEIMRMDLLGSSSHKFS